MGGKGLQDGKKVLFFFREEIPVKTTILGNLGNFCNEFILEGEGKILEILHLLMMQMSMIKRPKAAEIFNLIRKKAMFRIGLGIARRMYLSELHLPRSVLVKLNLALVLPSSRRASLDQYRASRVSVAMPRQSTVPSSFGYLCYGTSVFIFCCEHLA